MKILKNVESLRAYRAESRKSGIILGFVPTMGYLHEGHLSLVRLVQERTPETIVSIFVNPTQFNNPLDFEKYPMNLERDFALLEKANVSAVFVPSVEEFYGNRDRFQSWVSVETLSKPWEGTFRPGHYRGVATVVAMLFNTVQPDIAAFGEKDFQQLRVIEQMVEDLKFPVQIIRGETVREADGLAMSSRNVRLDAGQRSRALAISRGFYAARACFARGEKEPERILACVYAKLAEAKIEAIDYVALVDGQTLESAKIASPGQRLLAAVHLGDVRLIDAMAL